MSFASVYPLYVQKVAKKGRTKAELDEVIAILPRLVARRPAVAQARSRADRLHHRQPREGLGQVDLANRLRIEVDLLVGGDGDHGLVLRLRFVDRV